MSGAVEPSSLQSTSTSLLNSLNNTTPSPDTSSLSSPLQLLTAPFRAFQHVETFALRTIPQAVGRITGINTLWGGGIGSAAGVSGAVATNAVADMAGSGIPNVAGQEGSYYFAEFVGAIKKLGGFFGYLTSIWSFACLVEVSYGSKYPKSPR